MNHSVTFLNPVTGLHNTVSSVGDPSVALIETGIAVGGQTARELWLNQAVPQTAAGVSSGTAMMQAQGLYGDLLYGGPLMPSARVGWKAALLSADVSASATSLTVESYLVDPDAADEEPIIEAGESYWLMHRLPKPEEVMTATTNPEIMAELITISDAYDYTTDTGTNDGSTPTVSAVTTARKKWAWLVKAVPTPASWSGLAGFRAGYLYERERPTAVSGLAEDSTNCTATTLALTWTASSDKAIEAYAFFVLKKGDDYSPYHAPVSLPDDVTVSEYDATGQQAAIFTLTSDQLTLSTGTYSVAGINRYYNPSTRALSALTAETTYYVAIRALTRSTFDSRLRMSEPAIVEITTPSA